MGKDNYLSIEKKSEGIYKVRGSKFLAFAFPVYREDEIKNILAELRKEYHDARHHCYAYRLGASKEIYRVNDDGEPSSSAGKPIFGQIQSNDLTNILILVVRYFGGTLLGVGGLINAYRSAAADALINARIIERVESEKIIIHFSYELTNDIMKLVEDEKLEMIHQEYTEVCIITALVPKSHKDSVLQRINKLPEANAKAG